jgi:NAD(P)-dependent dehydrogenase (short-subunit alcohol dehydrogenase family)
MTKTALITGASRGLGETIATFLARSGYDLVLTARGEADLAEVASRLAGTGRRVIARAGDINDVGHRARLLDAVQELGGLDVLVNNASDLGPSPMPALVDYPLEALEQVLQTNVVAPVALVQDLLPALRSRRGLIVNITSDAAVGAYEGWGGYGASKSALELVSRTLAAELGDVSVVMVDPGDMRTQMHQDAFPGQDISDRPLPDVTVPFWAWLFASDHSAIDGRRFQAQGESWELAS